MLLRATLRPLRLLHGTPQPVALLRTVVPRASNSLIIRNYASPPRNPPDSPQPPGSKPRKGPPPPQPFRSGLGAPGRPRERGAEVPQDQTWKPKDGIKLGGPAAAAEKSAATSVDGSRPQDPAITRQQSPLNGDTNAQEPLAQKLDADEPVSGGARDQAQSAQAAAENTPPPPESPSQVEGEQQPSQPLPDLRQGIPSTFDIEFGQGRQGAQKSAQSEQDQGLDLTYETPERQRREGESRDYDRSAYETSLDRRRAQLANYLYATILFLGLSGAFYLARPFNARDEPPSTFPESDASGWAPGKMYARLRARIGSQMGYYTEPTFPKLLPEVPENQRQPLTLVLSLEDLMIHTTWDREHGYRTAKRPGIDYFIRYLSQYYELVLFTSVPITLADPIIKKLDPYHFIMWPLGREATKYEGGEYVKDLAYLNRPLNKTLIIDTHAPHVKNQPENAIIVDKWNGDPKDAHTKDLVSLIPFLEYVATMGVEDVRKVLKSFEGTHIPTEFARRESLAREKFLAQLEEQKGRRPKRNLSSLTSALGMKSQGGSMVLADGQSVSEGLAQGKMLSDQIREQGQKQYEFLEKQIREHGAQWLKEEEEEQKRLMEAQMKDMKKGAFSWFGSGGGKQE